MLRGTLRYKVEQPGFEEEGARVWIGRDGKIFTNYSISVQGFSAVMDAILSLGLMSDAADARLAPSAEPLTWVWWIYNSLGCGRAEYTKVM